MRLVVIEDFNGSISLVTDPDTGEVIVFDDPEAAYAEAGECQNGIVVCLNK